jgi:tetratricopeptide (TPR) repeat protein
MKKVSIMSILLLGLLLGSAGCQRHEGSGSGKSNAEIWGEYLLALTANDEDKMQAIVGRELKNIPHIIEAAIEMSSKMLPPFEYTRGENTPSMSAMDIAHVAVSMARVYAKYSKDASLWNRAWKNRVEVEAIELQREGLEALQTGDPQLAIVKWVQLLESSHLIGSKRHELWALFSLSRAYMQLEENDVAIDYLNQASELALEKDDQKSLTDIYFNMGVIELNRSNLEQAEQHFKSALKAAEAAGDEGKLKELQNQLAPYLKQN